MKCETVHFSGNGSAGTQNIVASTGFGTPQAAIVFSVSSITGPTNVSSRYMVGFWAGSNNHGMGLRINDGKAVSESARSFSASHLIPFTLAGTTDSVTEKMRVTGTITDGVQITWDSSSTSQYDMILITDVANATVGHLELSTSQANNDVTIGHEPHVVFVCGDLAPHTTDSVTNNAGISLGVAHYDGATTDQAVVAFFNRDNVTNCENGQIIRNDSVLAQVTDASETYKATFSRLSATEFRLASDLPGSTGGDTFYYLALALTDPTEFEMGIDSTPLSATNKVISTGAQRDSFGVIGTRLSAVNTWKVDTEAQGLFIGTKDGQSERTEGFRSQDGASTMVENCSITSNVFDLMAHNADTFTHTATGTFNASDITLAFSASEATARQFLWWASSDGGAGGPSIPTLSNPALASLTHESAIVQCDVTF